jgi:DNA-binding CsgD family transcriptional regulator
MLPVFPIDLTDPHHIKRSQALPLGKATAQRPKEDLPASALPLSPREQQVIAQRNQGLTFDAIANRLGCSLAAAKEYHRRALVKNKRFPKLAIAIAPSEQIELAIAKRTQKERLSFAVSECRS